MSSDVLRSRSQIQSARRELKARDLSFVENGFIRALRRHKLVSGINLGDEIKSWDVLKSIEFIEKSIDKGDSILDMGAFASEILCVLHKLGYSNLWGIDLNPELKAMPYSAQIHYEIGDMLNTPFQDASFSAITSISVIEHGYQGKTLFREVSRLLKPNGFFIVSFDYWPVKVDTSDTPMFEMPWNIFCKDEVDQFIELAEQFDLHPLKSVSLDVNEKVITWAKKQYTFAWLVLQKRVHQ